MMTPATTARIVTGALLGLLGSIVPASAQISARAELVASGLDKPLQVVTPRAELDKLFIVEQAGKIKILENGIVSATPFLDVTSKVFLAAQAGLVSLAFHPQYAANGLVYVYYSDDAGSSVLVRYTVPTPSSYVIDPGSETVLVTVTAPVQHHLGGGMEFGPGDKLFLAVGDQREVAGSCPAQEGDTLLGKLLRLNDDGSAPLDNPFVGNPAVLDEIWAFGLRQPYRLSFDSLTDDLYIADVGEGAIEELDFVPGSSTGGENFGWRVLEGSQCTGHPGCSALPCPDPTAVAPLHEIPHNVGCSIIGGYVYRGSDLPDLQGAYIYGDWCTGEVYALRHDGSVVTELVNLTSEITPVGPETLDNITSFGIDAAEELYIVDGFTGFPGTGEVYKLIPVFEAFADLGFALAGVQGPPSLEGLGTLEPGTLTTLRLRNAVPNGIGHLILGFSAIFAPFKKGVLVPALDIVLWNLPLDPSGSLELTFNWPTNLPAGVNTFWQYWFPDPAAVKGWSASNAVQGTTP